MKIVKQGSVNKLTNTRQYSCASCGCTFIADRSDFRSDRDGQYVTCPFSGCYRMISATSGTPVSDDTNILTAAEDNSIRRYRIFAWDTPKGGWNDYAGSSSCKNSAVLRARETGKANILVVDSWDDSIVHREPIV